MLNVQLKKQVAYGVTQPDDHSPAAGDGLERVTCGRSSAQHFLILQGFANSLPSVGACQNAVYDNADDTNLV